MKDLRAIQCSYLLIFCKVSIKNWAFARAVPSAWKVIPAFRLIPAHTSVLSTASPPQGGLPSVPNHPAVFSALSSEVPAVISVISNDVIS